MDKDAKEYKDLKDKVELLEVLLKTVTMLSIDHAVDDFKDSLSTKTERIGDVMKMSGIFEKRFPQEQAKESDETQS